MRREMANWLLQAKIKIKQIGGFTNSLSEYGHVWTWIAYFLKLIPNMNLKISISKILEHFILFLNPHRAFACMRWRDSRGDDHEISSYLHSRRYQNINLDQIKNRNINLMIISLIFYQNCNCLATHVDARSWNWWFFAIFGRQQPMRREMTNSLLKGEIKIKEIGGFTKSLSEYGCFWTWIVYFLKLIPNMNLKLSISKFSWTFYFFSLTHTVHLHACGGEAAGETIMISSYLHSKRYQNINLDQIKNRAINLVNIYLSFYQNCNFLATLVDARNWNGDFLLSSVESSRCAENWQTGFWKLKLKSNKLVDLRNVYPNKVVFGLELLIFCSWFRIWKWYRFPQFLNILFIFP